MASVAKLKKKYWTVFSRFIRLRDADKWGMCKCCTCGSRKVWKQMQAGHFISRVHSAVLFNEKNVHAQCVGCNMFKQGNPQNYWLFMEEKYGRKVIDELMEMRAKIRRFKATELEEWIQSTSKEVERLLERLKIA